jgi:hypothetical protein
MLSDGITERHADERVSVRDVAQLLLQSVDENGAQAKASQTEEAEK